MSIKETEQKVVAWYRSLKWWAQSLVALGVGIVIGAVLF